MKWLCPRLERVAWEEDGEISDTFKNILKEATVAYFNKSCLHLCDLVFQSVLKLAGLWDDIIY